MNANDIRHGADRRTMGARIVVGFLQGLALYVFTNFKQDQPQFGFTDAELWRRFIETGLTASLLAPLPLLFGLGNLPARTLAIWALIAAAAVALFAWLSPAPVWNGPPPVLTVWVFSLIVLYIVHELIQAAHDDGRFFASYETYFDRAWRHAFQAGLALGFVGAFWVVISLGAWLFRLIGLDEVYDVIFSDEFAMPASSLAFALGVHFTDAGAGLTRGARQIGLALLAWLAILMTLILTAFLGALPFTGLEPLWDTKRATVLLLNAAATMILLINAAFQAGEPPKNALLRGVVRFSAAPLAGVVALAALGLYLRIDQYGFTPARVVASAELLIVAFYAVGYVAAALKPGAWLSLVKPVNVAGAFVVAAILVALMTPIADPARVSVANQTARLESGSVDPDDFDFGFLADPRAGRWGEAALARLKTLTGDERSERIALLAANPGGAAVFGRTEQSFNDRRDAVILPDGAVPDAALLPRAGADPIAECVASMKQESERLRLAEERQRQRARLGRSVVETETVAPATDGGRCRARLVDLDFDGDEDLLLLGPRFHSRIANYAQLSALLRDGESWSHGGAASQSMPASEEEALAQFAAATPIAPLFDDIVVDDRRIRVVPVEETSVEERLAAIDLRDGRAPPPEALDRRLSVECSPNACFSRYVDLTGDGAEEWMLASFGWNVTAEFRIYQSTEQGWRMRATGSTASPMQRFEAPGAADRPPCEVDSGSPACLEVRRRLVDGASAASPLIADLDFGGERVVFSYDANADL